MKRTVLEIDSVDIQEAKELLTNHGIIWSEGRFHFDLSTFVVTFIVTSILAVILF